ncbi:MAG: glycosyltransferase family 4 protein [Marinobacter sp.]
MKTVWIINQYGNLPTTGIGGRHYYLSRELVNFGYKVTNISARWSHVIRDHDIARSAPEDEFVDGFRFYRINVPRYRHAHDRKRIINWFIFAFRLRSLPNKLDEKPDAIIYSSPSLIAFFEAYRLAKKFRCKLIFEVRDIWPLTLVELGGFSPKHPFIRLMQWIEDFAYKKSCYVISNLEGAVDHAKSRGLRPEKFYWIPNGYSEKELKSKEPASPEIIRGLEGQRFSVTYTGGIGEANSLDTLVEAAAYLKHRDDIHINVVGSGRLTHELKEMVKSLGLNNFHFWNAVPKSQVQSILQASDACVICWRASYLYKYGLAANKLFDYLYAGRPVINAYSGGYDIVARYKAGLTIPAEDPVALAHAISNFADTDPSILCNMGANGKKAATERHEYTNVALKLVSVLEADGGFS